MSDAPRYTSKRLPGGLYRVVDHKHDRVDGVWNPHDREFLNVAAWLHDE